MKAGQWETNEARAQGLPSLAVCRCFQPTLQRGGPRQSHRGVKRERTTNPNKPKRLELVGWRSGEKETIITFARKLPEAKEEPRRRTRKEKLIIQRAWDRVKDFVSVVGKKTTKCCSGPA